MGGDRMDDAIDNELGNPKQPKRQNRRDQAKE
jgi:hypothetical protein